MNPWQFGTWVEEQGELSVGGESWVGLCVLFRRKRDWNCSGSGGWGLARLDACRAGPGGAQADKASDNSMVHASTDPIQ